MLVELFFVVSPLVLDFFFEADVWVLLAVVVAVSVFVVHDVKNATPTTRATVKMMDLFIGGVGRVD